MATAYAEYAGVKLPLWTPDCDAALARANLDLSRFQQFNHAPDETVLNGLPLPPRPYPPPQRGGTLWWPTGAAQFARAHFVADTATLAAIRSALTTAAGSSTAGYTAATLKLDDGLGGSAVETAMHFLPPLPLVGSEDSYLVTLVDERYYWWFRPTISLSGVTTWSGLYSAIGTGIGSTVTVDGSLSSFAAPSSRWATLGTAPLPLLLDAAAWCTGRRIVRRLDGSVRATDYATAKSAAATVRSSWGSTYRRRGGGVQIDSDARKSAPASVLIKCGSLTQTPTLSGLSISDYSGVTGKSGYRATVQTDAATLTTSQANALATEWYQWLLAGETTSLAGLPAITPNGWYGAAEWVLRRDDCGLRLYPAPLDFGHSSGSDAAGEEFSLNSQNTDGTEVDSTTTDLRFNKTTGVQVTQSGGVSTVSAISTSPTQTGVVAAGGSGSIQSLGSGDKYLTQGGLHLCSPIDGSGLTTGTRIVGSVVYFSNLRMVAGENSYPVNDFYWDDVISYGSGDARHGRGAVTEDIYGLGGVNYVGYMCGPLPQVQNLNGVPTSQNGTPRAHVFGLIGPKPNADTGSVTTVGYMLTEGGVAWHGGSADVTVGSTTIRFRGGLYIDHFASSSPPPPASPPPPSPPPLSPPPTPLDTVTISGTVSRAAGDGGGALAGRTLTLLGVGTTTTTNGSGNYSFTTVGGGSRFVQLTLGSGELATHVVDGADPGFGDTAGVILTASTHDIDFTVDVPAATVNVTVQNAVGSAPLSGRTVTVGSTSQTTNGSGQTSFAGVAVGSTSVVLTLGGGESASWSVDTPSESGKGATATFTSTDGGTHGVTFQVSGVTSGGGE